MPYLATALLILLLLPAGAFAQANVSYQVPSDNPFAGQPGAAPEIYALGLRNPFRFSFDRETGDVLIGDVGGGQREEIDWVTAAAARGANFGWACREGTIAGPRSEDCPVPGAVEPLFEYLTSDPGGDAVTGGFVVRDPALVGVVGRYIYADFFEGVIHSIALDRADPDDQDTGAFVASLASFGEDASGRLYAVSLSDNEVVRILPGGTPGTLTTESVTGPFAMPIAIGTVPGDPNRLFVAERGGTVRLLVDGAVRPTPFADVAPFGLSTNGERGLLSVVAAPDYAASGKIYVYYTDTGGDIRIEELTRSAADPEIADPASRRTVLTIEHSSESNHNGGQLHFGSDGCLWVTTGDGGGQNNTHDNSQNLGTLLGKVLRIDPDPPGVGGPVCGPGSAFIPPPSGGGGTSIPDLAAPVVSARAPRLQRVLRLRGTIVYVRCSERCALEAGATLLVRGRRLLLKAVRTNLEANQRARIRLVARSRARRLLRRALRRRGHPRVMLRLHATDDAGNRSATLRRGVRVRR
jgi:glucose/arabinose dehydrogenase